MVTEEYMKGYAEGYSSALVKQKESNSQPYIDKDGIIERYGGKIGQNKAYEIIRSVRRYCNGGKLDSCSMVLISELEYWESIVDKKYLERL